MNKYKHALKILLDRQNAGRNLTVYADDIFLVSYPKSGNTWLRFLIGNLINAELSIDFSNIESIVPDIYQNTDDFLLRTKRPRLLKSHESFVPEYNKVIYIVRDPRDVLVSYYFHAKKFHRIDRDESVSNFIPMFLNGSIDQYGSWYEHVGSWIGAREEGDSFLVLRYEDILNDTFNFASKINSFLNLSNSETSIKRAIESSSSDHMKKLEKDDDGKWKATKNSDQSLPFVRNAKSGNWKNHLNIEEAESIESNFEKYMKYFGYT